MLNGTVFPIAYPVPIRPVVRERLAPMPLIGRQQLQLYRDLYLTIHRAQPPAVRYGLGYRQNRPFDAIQQSNLKALQPLLRQAQQEVHR